MSLPIVSSYSESGELFQMSGEICFGVLAFLLTFCTCLSAETQTGHEGPRVSAVAQTVSQPLLQVHSSDSGRCLTLGDMLNSLKHSTSSFKLFGVAFFLDFPSPWVEQLKTNPVITGNKWKSHSSKYGFVRYHYLYFSVSCMQKQTQCESWCLIGEKVHVMNRIFLIIQSERFTKQLHTSLRLKSDELFICHSQLWMGDMTKIIYHDIINFISV